MMQLERLSKAVLLLAPLLGAVWGGLWYTRHHHHHHHHHHAWPPAAATTAAAVSSTCQKCLAEGKDFCISSNSCIPRATFGCNGAEDHITGDPEFAKPGPRASRGLHEYHHEHHHKHHHEDHHKDHREHHHEHHHKHHHKRHPEREGHHPGHSMVCPPSAPAANESSQCEACLANGKDFCISTARCIQRAWPSGVGARDRRQCPCKQAKTRCISASGERNNEGDCEDLWRTCKERKKQKSDMVKAAWGDAMTM